MARIDELLLVRHGKPLCDYRTKISGCDFGRWVATYEDAPLDPSFAPPDEFAAQVARFRCLLTSTKRRAIESAALVAPDRPRISDPLFNEAAIPTRFRARVALAPEHWDGIVRIAWMLGWSGGVESITAAKTRAVRAANHLAGLASTYGSVVLFGHGMINTLIVRELRRNGWIGTGTPRAYWGRVILNKAIQ